MGLDNCHVLSRAFILWNYGTLHSRNCVHLRTDVLQQMDKPSLSDYCTVQYSAVQLTFRMRAIQDWYNSVLRRGYFMESEFYDILMVRLYCQFLWLTIWPTTITREAFIGKYSDAINRIQIELGTAGAKGNDDCGTSRSVINFGPLCGSFARFLWKLHIFNPDESNTVKTLDLI